MSKFRTAFPAVALAGGLALATAGCAPAQSADSEGCEETYTIGFSHPVGEASGPKAVKSFLEEFAQEEGCVTVLLDSTTGNNLETQRTTVEGWVTQGIDSILLWPVDPSAFVNLQKQAQEKGTKWLTYVAAMDGQDGSVGFDSDVSGELIASDMQQWIKAHYPDGGVSAAVTTLTALPTVAGRWEKPLAALEEAGIPVVSEQDCADQACGLQVAEDALRENPDLRIFVGINDDAALGARKAFANAGIDPETVYIAGYDGTPEGLAAIEEGGAFRISATIPPKPLAADILAVSLAAIRGEGDTDRLTEPVLAKTGDTSTLDDLLSQFDAR